MKKCDFCKYMGPDGYCDYTNSRYRASFCIDAIEDFKQWLIVHEQVTNSKTINVNKNYNKKKR